MLTPKKKLGENTAIKSSRTLFSQRTSGLIPLFLHSKLEAASLISPPALSSIRSRRGAKMAEEVTFSWFQKALAIVPKCSGFISLCSSIFLVQHVFKDKKRRNLTYHRLLGFMSISDIIGSSMCVLSTWPVPRNSGTYGAIGTVATCEVAGFFNQSAALTTPTFNVSLAIYFVLVIVYGWKERRIQKIEKFLIAIPFILGFSTGIVGLALDLFNGASWICWIAPGGDMYPERTNPDYGAYRLGFLYIDAWVIILILAIAMAVIYSKTLKQERKTDRWRSSVGEAKRRDQSIKIRNQAFLYVGCMYITWTFGSVYRFMQFAGATPPKAIVILFVTFFPLQGFFNLVVYMYPRFVSESEKNPDKRLSKRLSSIMGFPRSSPTVTESSTIRTQSENEGKQSKGSDDTTNKPFFLIDLAEVSHNQLEDNTGSQNNSLEEGNLEETDDPIAEAIQELATAIEHLS